MANRSKPRHGVEQGQMLLAVAAKGRNTIAMAYSHTLQRGRQASGSLGEVGIAPAADVPIAIDANDPTMFVPPRGVRQQARKHQRLFHHQTEHFRTRKYGLAAARRRLAPRRLM